MAMVGVVVIESSQRNDLGSGCTDSTEKGSQGGMLPTTACLQDRHCPFGKVQSILSVPVPKKSNYSRYVMCEDVECKAQCLMGHSQSI